MAAQPHIRLSAEQEKFVEKIKPGAGVIFPRRHGATTALAQYVRTHPKEVKAYIAPSKRFARKFKEDTDHAVEVYGETHMALRGLSGFLLLDGCRSSAALSLTPRAFTAFNPQFTVPQARKLWFKDTTARLVVRYDRMPVSYIDSMAASQYGVQVTDSRVSCHKDFQIGDDIDALIPQMRAELRAVCQKVSGDSVEEVYIQEAIYLEGEDLLRVARIQLE